MRDREREREKREIATQRKRDRENWNIVPGVVFLFVNMYLSIISPNFVNVICTDGKVPPTTTVIKFLYFLEYPLPNMQVPENESKELLSTPPNFNFLTNSL